MSEGDDGMTTKENMIINGVLLLVVLALIFAEGV